MFGKRESKRRGLGLGLQVSDLFMLKGKMGSECYGKMLKLLLDYEVICSFQGCFSKLTALSQIPVPKFQRRDS